MKKILTYVIVLTLIALLTIGATYAAFTATVESRTNIDVGTHQIKIIYNGGGEFDGFIDLVESKEDGFRKVVSIAIARDSVDTTGSIYFYLEDISEGLATSALKWEVYKYENETETYIDSGTFEGTSAGDKVYMLKDIERTENLQQFAVYLWLNGHEAGNETRQATFSGFIGAESGIVSGIISDQNED